MKISIITTTFNSASTIRDTMRSVLNQFHTDVEHIIIDGGSTDGTLDIIREVEPQYFGTLRYISEPDRGIYDAMNKGIRMATGDIIGILNSDDFFTSYSVLREVNQAFEDNPIDAVFGDIHFVHPDDLTHMVRYYSSEYFRPWKLRFGYMPAHPSFYCRREVYEKHGLYSLDYKICSDYDMMVRLFHRAKITYRYLPLDFVTMRTGGISTSSIKNRILITREDVKACRAYGLYTNFPLACTKYLTKIFEFV